jgi:hypothetical protein
MLSRPIHTTPMICVGSIIWSQLEALTYSQTSQTVAVTETYLICALTVLNNKKPHLCIAFSRETKSTDAQVYATSRATRQPI